MTQQRKRSRDAAGKPAARFLPPPPPGVRVSLAHLATPAERERCRVLSWHQSRLAARHELVRALRRKLFGREAATITRAQAFALLGSPAAAYLGLEFFEEHGIPLAAHRSSVRTLRLRQEPPKGEPVAFVEDYVVDVKWSGGSARREGTATRSDVAGYRMRPVLVPSPDGRPRTVSVHACSLLHDIAERCGGLAAAFLWTEPEALLFALTGDAPTIEPASLQIEVAVSSALPLRAEVVLRLQPFVSLRTARRAAEQARHMPRRASAEARGISSRAGRPVAERTLALFQFVEEQTDRNGGKRPSWGKLVDRWDDLQRKEWGYDSERAHLRRDYERARRLLTESAHALMPELDPAREVGPERTRRMLEESRPAKPRGKARKVARRGRR